MKLLKFAPLLLLGGCVSTPYVPEVQYPDPGDYRVVETYPVIRPSVEPIETESPDLERFPRRPTDRPSNWGLERKVVGNNAYVISRSLEDTQYMWFTCKIEPNGVTGLSLGIVQPDDIGYRGDSATLIFMVDGREVIFGEGLMVNNKNGGLRSFDPRRNSDLNELERDSATIEWLADQGRIAQYEVVGQMMNGDYVDAKISLIGISREIEVDLQGFPESAHQVITACNAGL